MTTLQIYFIFLFTTFSISVQVFHLVTENTRKLEESVHNFKTLLVK